ncbi:MAG: hypothetical protein M3N52_12510 [Actinomycetota bacterium]|nr:hypothetical protein [Actinomycetota bacterium]
MTATLERLQELDELDQGAGAGTAAEPVPARSAPRRQGPGGRRPRHAPDATVSDAWAGFGVVAWVVLLGVAIAVEPPAADSVVPPLANVAAIGFLLALGVAFVGLSARLRWGFAASLIAALTLTGMSLACPATGHHTLAPWWFAQLACALGLVAVSIAGLRRA